MKHTAADKNPTQYFHCRSQRIAVRRNFLCSQANVRSTFHRSPRSASGRPFGFDLDFQTRFGMCGCMPRLRIFFSQLFRIVTLVHLSNNWSFSRSPSFPSFEAHCVQKRKNLIPFACCSASVNQRQRNAIAIGERMNRNALSFEPVFHSLSAAFASSKRSIYACSIPENQAGELCDPENPLFQIRPSSVGLPNSKPPMRCGASAPDLAFGSIGPAAASDQYPKDGIHDFSEICTRLAPASYNWRRGKKLRNYVPLRFGEAVESAGHKLSSYSRRQYLDSSESTRWYSSYYWDRLQKKLFKPIRGGEVSNQRVRRNNRLIQTLTRMRKEI